MQGWHYGKGLIYYTPIFRLTKEGLPQCQSYTERKYLLKAPKIAVVPALH